ncbi:MAG: ribosome maturation factor RimM [Dehalococcoidia bacterium]
MPRHAPSPPPEAPSANEPQPSRPKPQRDPDAGFVAVGRVLGAFGLKGELRVQSLSDNPKRFAPRSKLWLGTQPVSVVRSREAQGYVYLTLKGFTDRSSIEHFRGAIVQVPEGDLPPLPEGEFYRFQLVGLAVFDRAGAALGTVEEVLETGANDVYRVRTADDGEILIPALQDVVVSIDLEAKRMVVDPPDWR